MKIVLKEQLIEMVNADERRYDWLRIDDAPNGVYDLWVDRKTNEYFWVRIPRCIRMGFNSIRDEDVKKLTEVVMREGVASAYWGVTGRTMHSMLANQLASRLPQFRFEIGDNYECVVYRDAEVVL